MSIFAKLLVIVLLSGALGLSIYYDSVKKYLRYGFILILTVSYIYLLLTITFINREKLPERTAVLMPGYNFRHVLDYPWFYTTTDGVEANIGNVILFIPLGMTAVYLIRTKHPYIACGTIACFASIVIEAVQYFTQLGSFEMDDIIHNTWGAIIGCSIVLVLMNKERDVRAIAKRLMPLWSFVALMILISLVSVVAEGIRFLDRINA